MSSDSSPKLPSERSFGLFFTAFFSGLGLYGIYKEWDLYPVFFLFAASGALLLFSICAPRLLAPLNKAWFWIGQFLGKIVSPIVLGVIFFGLLTPIAVITRLLGRDELRLKRQDVTSYWIDRAPPGPACDSFKNQF
jgi:hypothetical protein